MADPQHEEELDGLDQSTVRLYRSGLSLAPLALLLTAGLEVWGKPLQPTLTLCSMGIVLSVACMHLYDKRIRWVIASSSWTGAVLQLSAPLAPDSSQHLLWCAGQGFLFVSLSALALKEQFCFRVPLLKAVPLFLAVSLIPLTFQIPGSGVPLGITGLVLAALAIQKWKMPLHFDIGDRGLYQN